MKYFTFLNCICLYLCVCVCVQTQCQELRKRKNLELQILSEPVRGWEGDSMKSLGHVAYMSQVHMKNGSSEVRARFSIKLSMFLLPSDW